LQAARRAPAAAAKLPFFTPDMVSSDAALRPAFAQGRIDTMRFFVLIVSGLLLAGTTAPVSAKPAYVPSTVNLRAGAGTDKEILGKIPSGSLIDVGECTGGWCAVTWQDKKGYAIQTAIDMTGRVPPRRTASRRYYVEEPPIYYEVPPPPVYYGPYYRRHYFGPWGPRYRW